jgi:hypothetical protein
VASSKAINKRETRTIFCLLYPSIICLKKKRKKEHLKFNPVDNTFFCSITWQSIMYTYYIVLVKLFTSSRASFVNRITARRIASSSDAVHTTNMRWYKHILRLFGRVWRYHCHKAEGPSCPWSYDSWFTTTYTISAYHHLCCEFESRSLCDKVCQWLVTGRWFSLGPPVSSTNKTDLHDIADILLKGALDTIKQTNKHKPYHYETHSIE